MKTSMKNSANARAMSSKTSCISQMPVGDETEATKSVWQFRIQFDLPCLGAARVIEYHELFIDG